MWGYGGWTAIWLTTGGRELALTGLQGFDARVCVRGAGTTTAISVAVAARGCAARVAVVELGSRPARGGSPDEADAAVEPGNREAVEIALRGMPDIVIETAEAPSVHAASLEPAALGRRTWFLCPCPAERTVAPMRLIQARNLHPRGSAGAPPAIWARAMLFLESLHAALFAVINNRLQLDSVPDAFRTRTTSNAYPLRLLTSQNIELARLPARVAMGSPAALMLRRGEGS